MGGLCHWALENASDRESRRADLRWDRARFHGLSFYTTYPPARWFYANLGIGSS